MRVLRLLRKRRRFNRHVSVTRVICPRHETQPRIPEILRPIVQFNQRRFVLCQRQEDVLRVSGRVSEIAGVAWILCGGVLQKVWTIKFKRAAGWGDVVRVVYSQLEATTSIIVFTVNSQRQRCVGRCRCQYLQRRG